MEFTEVVNCPHCSHEVEYLAAKCGSCGIELDWGNDENLMGFVQEWEVCPHCHKEVLPGSKFCSECGSMMRQDGMISYTQDRVLPHCPQCGSELDYGATFCENCQNEVEWESGEDLLIDFNSFKEKEVIPRQNRPRVPVSYKVCTLHFDTFTQRLNPNSRRTKVSPYFDPPRLQYNSFGVYS